MDRNRFRASRTCFAHTAQSYSDGSDCNVYQYQIVMKLHYQRLTSTCMEFSGLIDKGIVARRFLQSLEAVPVIRIIP